MNHIKSAPQERVPLATRDGANVRRVPLATRDGANVRLDSRTPRVLHAGQAMLTNGQKSRHGVLCNTSKTKVGLDWTFTDC